MKEDARTQSRRRSPYIYAPICKRKGRNKEEGELFTVVGVEVFDVVGVVAEVVVLFGRVGDGSVGRVVVVVSIVAADGTAVVAVER